MQSIRIPGRGLVLYDGECAFCMGAVRFWKPVLRRAGFHAAPLQTPWVRERLALGPSLLHDIRMLLPSGTTLAGTDVYLYVADHIVWARPLARLLRTPPLRRLLDAGYRWVARNRYCAGYCELPGK